MLRLLNTIIILFFIFVSTSDSETINLYYERLVMLTNEKFDIILVTELNEIKISFRRSIGS